MPTDHELFNLIKETYPLNPKAEFISNTDTKLKQLARNLDKKKRVKKWSLASVGMVFCIMAFSWFFFFSGKEIINNALSFLDQSQSAAPIHEKNPTVLIHHTHNRESFTSLINVDNPDLAHHKSKNITLVGDRLAKSLQKEQIFSLHHKTDGIGLLNEMNLEYFQAYQVSREPLKKALDKNKSNMMVFDIHRSSGPRMDTTVELNRKKYAKISFINSKSSEKFEENNAFAKLLHQKIEKKYPGISRGVFVKSQERQSTYNQDLMGQSVLINIGGVENTLEEEYRTADILAEVIGEVMMEL
ncbi:stage II sporulation protein P [Bacillus pakistanensis]|uniref:Stage II sporulation protein P n=1 Tax=Rossellomorea pakistanensis TaxID=992288 RepID=A0ABS2NHN2_9BACI|nr:stage II sporulation protein P [Bacillus pakistanensis]MBM7587051.1 stage II sporulation protein P [Bacillus pakistanensis]